VKPFYLICINDSKEYGVCGSDVIAQSGLGEVTIDEGGDRTNLNYDSRYQVNRELNKSVETEIYIEGDQIYKDKYLFAKNRLRLNKYTGDGYFQSGTYNLGDAKPRF
jgi:hypothetical protein